MNKKMIRLRKLATVTVLGASFAFSMTACGLTKNNATESATVTEVVTEAESTTEANADASTEAAKEEEITTEADDAEAAASGAAAGADEITFTTIRGCSCKIPAGFEEIIEDRAIRFVYEFYNKDLDMDIRIIDANKDYIPMSLEEEYNSYLNSYDITYKGLYDDWFVVSGYTSDGKVIYYKAHEKTLNGEKVYISMEFTYPNGSNKAKCDEMVGEFVKSFKFPE